MGGLYEYIKWQFRISGQIRDVLFLPCLVSLSVLPLLLRIVSIGEGTKNQMNSEIDGIGGADLSV